MKAAPTVPGYELFSCLGGGSMTAVYAAHNLADDFPCAVKLLRPEWDDQPMAVKLLQREARACLAVEHPRLVKVLDVHVTAPPYFLVMELLPGESLRRRLRRDYRLQITEALWITRQLAEALAALHKKNFLHGDVKPDNVRLVADGEAILLDLGFAHRPGENAVLAEEGYLLGTANYLAPELCGPHAENDDPRSDIFSLGAMLHEMIVGRLPYPSGSVQKTLRRHQTEQPLLHLEECAPSALRQLLNRTLEMDPRRRPSARQLIGELIGLEIASLGVRRAA